MSKDVPTGPLQPKGIPHFPKLPNGPKLIISLENESPLTLEDVEVLLSEYELLAHPDPPIRPDDPEITAIAKELWPHVQKCGLTKYNCSSAPPPKTYKEWYEIVYRKDSSEYHAALEHVAGAGKRIMELLVCVRGPLCRLSELCEPHSSRKLGAKKTFEAYRLAAKKPTPDRLERVTTDLELIRAKVRRREEETAKHASSPEGQGGDSGTNWQDVRSSLLNLYRAGEPYTSLRNLAGRLGCSPYTIKKAIKNSDKLKVWMRPRGKGSPGVQSLTEVVTDQTPDQRESDPADLLLEEDVDQKMSELIQQAGPEERAELNSYTPEQRRRIVGLHLLQKREPDSPPPNFDVAKEKPIKLGRKL